MVKGVFASQGLLSASFVPCIQCTCDSYINHLLLSRDKFQSTCISDLACLDFASFPPSVTTRYQIYHFHKHELSRTLPSSLTEPLTVDMPRQQPGDAHNVHRRMDMVEFYASCSQHKGIVGKRD